MQKLTTCPLVAIVMVNWNGYEYTVNCLESLENLDYPNYSVIVVDNASSDESEVKLRQRYPRHTVLQSGANLGFGGGSNLGILHALSHGADYVLLLNSDTKVSQTSLTRLVNKSESDSRIGLTGGRIEKVSPPGRTWACGGAFNVNTGTARHFLNEKDLHAFEPKPPWYLYIPACLVLIRRRCIEDIGLLSEKYFHLAEDVEYCVRAQRKGWTLALDPEALVFHEGSASMQRFSPLYNYYEQRNRLFVIRQYRTIRKSIWLKLRDVFAIVTRLLFTLVVIDEFRHFLQGAGFLTLAVYDFARDRDGKLEDNSRYHTLSSLPQRRARRRKGDP